MDSGGSEKAYVWITTVPRPYGGLDGSPGPKKLTCGWQNCIVSHGPDIAV